MYGSAALKDVPSCRDGCPARKARPRSFGRKEPQAGNAECRECKLAKLLSGNPIGSSGHSHSRSSARDLQTPRAVFLAACKPGQAGQPADQSGKPVSRATGRSAGQPASQLGNRPVSPVARSPVGTIPGPPFCGNYHPIFISQKMETMKPCTRTRSMS